QVARRALIGAGRIGEPVANHPGAALERRQNRLLQMVGAGGGEHERLSGRAEIGRKAGKDRLSERLGARRAAGLAGADHGKTECGETLLEPPRLDRLAGALPALEGDEAAPRLRHGPSRRHRAASLRRQSCRTKPTAGPSCTPRQVWISPAWFGREWQRGESRPSGRARRPRFRLRLDRMSWLVLYNFRWPRWR